MQTLDNSLLRTFDAALTAGDDAAGAAAVDYLLEHDATLEDVLMLYVGTRPGCLDGISAWLLSAWCKATEPEKICTTQTEWIESFGKRRHKVIQETLCNLMAPWRDDDKRQFRYQVLGLFPEMMRGKSYFISREPKLQNININLTVESNWPFKSIDRNTSQILMVQGFLGWVPLLVRYTDLTVFFSQNYPVCEEVPPEEDRTMIDITSLAGGGLTEWAPGQMRGWRSRP